MGHLFVESISQQSSSRVLETTFEGHLRLSLLKDVFQDLPRDRRSYIIIDFFNQTWLESDYDETCENLVRALSLIEIHYENASLIIVTDNTRLGVFVDKLSIKGRPITQVNDLAEFERLLQDELRTAQTGPLANTTFQLRDQLRLQLIQTQNATIRPLPADGQLVLKNVSNDDRLSFNLESELFVGRKIPNVSYPLDVDLTEWRAYQYGISRQHARFDLTPERFLDVVDLGSANGTFLHGVRLTPFVPYRLTHGNIICFGYMLVEIIFQPAP